MRCHVPVLHDPALFCHPSFAYGHAYVLTCGDGDGDGVESKITFARKASSRKRDPEPLVTRDPYGSHLWLQRVPRICQPIPRICWRPEKTEIMFVEHWKLLISMPQIQIFACGACHMLDPQERAWVLLRQTHSHALHAVAGPLWGMSFAEMPPIVD